MFNVCNNLWIKYITLKILKASHLSVLFFRVIQLFSCLVTSLQSQKICSVAITVSQAGDWAVIQKFIVNQMSGQKSIFFFESLNNLIRFIFYNLPYYIKKI